MSVQTYQCPQCGLNYVDAEVAKQCEAFCREHNACSFEITQNSIEYQKVLSHRKQAPA